MSIHPTAVVSKEAKIGAGTTIGPYSVIGADVTIGRGNLIGSHVVIDGYTTIGDENQIFQFASIGARPQDLKYHGEKSTLLIGNRNIIREYATLQPGTEGGGMKTVIGNENLFMACTHVGHDGIIGDKNIFANSAALAGHVTVGDRVTVGGLVGIHQFVKLGDLSLISAGAMVTKDIPPYCIAHGDRAELVGINKIGLERAKFTENQISDARRAYRTIFLTQGILREKLQKLKEEIKGSDIVLKLIDFIENSERGVTTARRKHTEDGE